MTSPLEIFFLSLKLIDSMLPWVCTVNDHRRCQDMVETFSDTLDCASCATFLVCCHILTSLCDLSLNRPTAGDMESIS